MDMGIIGSVYNNLNIGFKTSSPPLLIIHRMSSSERPELLRNSVRS